MLGRKRQRVYSYGSVKRILGEVALCLFGCARHVHYILNAVVKKGPGVLKVWRRVLKHHQLCGVVDARQRSPFSVPVHLQ